MKKELKISAASILFYVAAVVFLGIAVFYIWQTYVMISNYAEAGQSINITAALDNYFTYCAPYSLLWIRRSYGETYKFNACDVFMSRKYARRKRN